MLGAARTSVQTTIAAFILCCAAMPGTAAEQAVSNKDVAKYLTEAKNLAAGKRWDAAWAALEKAERVPEASPYVAYKINEFKGYVLTQQRKYAEAAALFDQLAKSESASDDERNGHLKTASQLYMRGKQYDKSARAAEAALAKAPNDPALLELAGQSRYLAGDFRGAAARIGQLVAATERKAGQPQEAWLQILLDSYYRLNDRKEISQTWAMLLRHYPKPEYWRNVLKLRSAERHSEQVELYYLALKFDVGMLDDAADYEALALGAIDLGLPDDAVRVLEAGLRKGTLAGKHEPRFRRMLAHAQAETAKSAARVKDLAQQAQRATTGQLDAAIGRVYLGQRMYDHAIAALRKSLQKGELQHSDQARIDLGVADLKNGKTQQARDTFADVKSDSEWRDLAELWSLRANEVAQTTEQQFRGEPAALKPDVVRF
jgi:tetratricopeptide (TPR) repeat protein